MSMTAIQVLKLMKTSKTEAEWEHNCEKVKAAHDGNYPNFWFETIFASGVAKEVTARWGGDDQLHIIELPG